MDLIFNYLDPLIIDSIYDSFRSSLQLRLCSTSHSLRFCSLITDSKLWCRESIYRQSLSIFIVTWFVHWLDLVESQLIELTERLSSSVFFLLLGTVCHYLYFDKALTRHPKYHKNQIRHEIYDSLLSLFGLNVLTVPIFVAQARGYAKLYDFGSGKVPLWYEFGQFLFFVLFSDTCMYWLHRIFHINFLFNLMHKKHHRYIIPTPFSAYAFDPLEAYIMSLPIYAYSFLWPMSREAQLIVFVTTNIWTILLHDNRDQFHTVHHKNVKLNFGQFLTLWDQLGGTYADPEKYFAGRREGKVKT
ncbi:hypothetical protein BDV35DRAFT_407043 [Aspergillus flavus]|uniref:Fatty acid hydroxylase domain-containing protein n=1 Tax=Aspergillus flavus TaxID=5059 RepID=A0A5N6GPB2_ASPFL|nr:hypothetical protein BDV35DRAFT_407043 [Aspergillus flavus]RAQ58324.1 ABC transporter [Aspergillus flavus]RAQ63083.1 ABC transporter [Aspergillus flavus]